MLNMSTAVEMNICMNSDVPRCESFLIQVRARGFLGSVSGNQGLNESILPYLLYRLPASNVLEEQSRIRAHFCLKVELTSSRPQAWHQVECSSLSVLARCVRSPVWSVWNSSCSRSLLMPDASSKVGEGLFCAGFTMMPGRMRCNV